MSASQAVRRTYTIYAADGALKKHTDKIDDLFDSEQVDDNVVRTILKRMIVPSCLEDGRYEYSIYFRDMPAPLVKADADTYYKDINYEPAWSDVSGKPSAFPTAWSNVSDKPSTFTPSAHNHDDLYRAASWVPTWSEVSGKPTTFTPAVHNHNDLYRSISWAPSWDDVSNKPSTFAPSNRMYVGNVTTTAPYKSYVLLCRRAPSALHRKFHGWFYGARRSGNSASIAACVHISDTSNSNGISAYLSMVETQSLNTLRLVNCVYGGEGWLALEIDSVLHQTLDSTGIHATWAYSANGIELGMAHNDEVSEVEAFTSHHMTRQTFSGTINAAYIRENGIALEDKYSPISHNHNSLYRPISWVPSWNDVSNKPSTFTPSAHTHDEILGKAGFTWDNDFRERKIFAIAQNNTGSGQAANYTTTLHVGAGDNRRNFQIASSYGGTNAFYMRSMWDNGNSGAGAYKPWEQLVTVPLGDDLYKSKKVGSAVFPNAHGSWQVAHIASFESNMASDGALCKLKGIIGPKFGRGIYFEAYIGMTAAVTIDCIVYGPSSLKHFLYADIGNQEPKCEIYLLTMADGGSAVNGTTINYELEIPADNSILTYFNPNPVWTSVPPGGLVVPVTTRFEYGRLYVDNDIFINNESITERFVGTKVRGAISSPSHQTIPLLDLKAQTNAGTGATLLSGRIESNTNDRFFMQFYGSNDTRRWAVSTDGVLREGTVPWARLSNVPSFAASDHLHDGRYGLISQENTWSARQRFNSNENQFGGANNDPVGIILKRASLHSWRIHNSAGQLRFDGGDNDGAINRFYIDANGLAFFTGTVQVANATSDTHALNTNAANAIYHRIGAKNTTAGGLEFVQSSDAWHNGVRIWNAAEGSTGSMWMNGNRLSFNMGNAGVLGLIPTEIQTDRMINTNNESTNEQARFGGRAGGSANPFTSWHRGSTRHGYIQAISSELRVRGDDTLALEAGANGNAGTIDARAFINANRGINSATGTFEQTSGFKTLTILPDEAAHYLVILQCTSGVNLGGTGSAIAATLAGTAAGTASVSPLIHTNVASLWEMTINASGTKNLRCNPYGGTWRWTILRLF